MIKFKPFVAHAQCCDSILLLLRARAYVSCKCGKTSVDAGDGYYHRLNVHEGVSLPLFYWQRKKGDTVLLRKKKR
jgi:hypothetical protein